MGSQGWAFFLPGIGGARPCSRLSGQAQSGLDGPSCLSWRPNQQAPPSWSTPSPSGDRKSAQQMRKWQAGWPWGLLSGPAPSKPSTAARLAPHW